MKKFLIILILFVTFSVYPQTCDEASGSCLNSSATLSKTENLALNAVNQLKLAINSLEGQIDGLRKKQPFYTLGQRLISALFMIVFIWSMIKNMLIKPHPQQIVVDLVFPLIVLGLAYATLDQNLGQVIVDSIDQMTSQLIEKAPLDGTSCEVFAENLIKSMLAIWSAPNPIDPLTLGLEAAISFLLKIVSIFFIGSSIAVGLAYLLLAKFQISLAIVLAPMMIPWIIWKPTEFIFSSWLTFLLKSSFVSLTVFTIELMLRTSISNLVNLSDSVTQGVNSAFVYGTISLLSVLFSLLISKSYAMGTGLISGVTSGFSKLSPIKN